MNSISHANNQSAFDGWKELESYSAEAISSLIKEHLRNSFGEIKQPPQWGASCHVQGKSGFDHQIDFHIDFDKAEVIGECKFYSEHVGVKDALCFIGRKADISSTICSDRTMYWLFVTNTDFTTHARKLLDAHNIKTARFSSKSDFILDLDKVFFLGIPGSDFFASGVPRLGFR